MCRYIFMSMFIFVCIFAYEDEDETRRSVCVCVWRWIGVREVEEGGWIGDEISLLRFVIIVVALVLFVIV